VATPYILLKNHVSQKDVIQMLKIQFFYYFLKIMIFINPELIILCT